MIEPIDLTGLLPAHLMATPEILRAVVTDIAEATRTEIVSRAQERLKSSGQDYVEGVMPVKYHYPTGKIPLTGPVVVASIVLTGWLPNAIEFGWEGGDLKPFLLSGRNARGTKGGGRYNVVPFRHGTPSSSGRSFAPMGSQHERRGLLTHEEAFKMGKKIHHSARKLAETTSHGDTGTQWGGRLRSGFSPLLKPFHTTDIHEGMIKGTKVYRHGEGTQYHTFRGVSNKSDPQKWIHPGIEPHRFFQDAAVYATRIAGYLVGKGMEAL